MKIFPLRFACCVVLVFAACQPTPNKNSDRKMIAKDIDSVMSIYVDSLMALPGVVGVYRGELENGTPCIKVMVVKKTKELEERIPPKLDNHPVIVEETGEIRPLKE